VVDIASRHLPPPVAAERAVAAAGAAGDARAASAPGAALAAHKIDSLLRGNWATELVARQRATGRPVIVVAALPSMGRTCRDGVVLVDGEELDSGARDARAAATTSRPAEHLRRAGASAVVEVAAAAGLAALADHADRPVRSPFVVVDAATIDDLREIGTAWRRFAPDAILAGTAEAIAVAAAPDASDPPVAPTVTGELLVVCGSLHPSARRQLERLAQRDVDGLAVVASPGDVVAPVPAEAAAAMAVHLATRARGVLAARQPAAVIVIGGDTAGALLGDAPRLVGGMVAPGAPWSRPVRADGPLVVTRAGSFGADDALVDLVGALRP
jgi:uncharacterized protein YgbK (DUF1537 family)